MKAIDAFVIVSLGDSITNNIPCKISFNRGFVLTVTRRIFDHAQLISSKTQVLLPQRKSYAC